MENLNYSFQLKIQLVNQDSIQISASSSNTIRELKKAIQNQNSLLTADLMNLFFNGRKLQNAEIISQSGISYSSILVQKKLDLDEVPGLKLTYKPDCLTFDDEIKARALMPCGHAVSTESMIIILQNFIDSKRNEIKCPAKKNVITNNGQQSIENCDTIWSYELCRKVGVLTLEERQKFEVGAKESLNMKGMERKQYPVYSSQITKNNFTEKGTNSQKSANKSENFDFC